MKMNKHKIKIVCTLVLLILSSKVTMLADGYECSDFENIINIRLTPNGNERLTGCFSDQGAWMGFTIPEAGQSVGGFCGPFSINSRKWIAKSVIALKERYGIFRATGSNYTPGKIAMTLQDRDSRAEEQLIFADSRTALFNLCTYGMDTLQLQALEPGKGVKMVVEGRHVVMHGLPEETIMLTFPAGTKLSTDGTNYMAVMTGNIKDATIAISMLLPGDRISVQKLFAEQMTEQFEQAERAGRERWNGYINKILRQDMPVEYNRMAVKAITTLISNWRVQRGGLLHDGIVPSHAIGYFVGCWAWDCWRFSAAMAHFFPSLAKDNIRVMFDYQQSDGMVIDCIYTDPKENNARDSKPPLACWAVDEIWKATADTAFVREMYPKLLAYYKWWYKKRDHDGNGICEFGSTDGTLEAAAWESGMDNAIRFDGARMLKNGENAWSINQESVDLNGYLAYEYTILKKFSKILNEKFEEPDMRGRIADYFFDTKNGYFFDRRLTDGSFVREAGCEGYLPFWTKIATQQQWKMAKKTLEDKTKFSTYIPFPTIAADNPKYDPNGYWRGPIWLDQTYYAIEGFRNYGEHAKADMYTRQVFDRLEGLTADAPIYENYDTFTGKGLQASHFSWSAAHLLMLYRSYGEKR
ncbi:MGH1-like glycoside hydrolase domain-containing protein [Hallella bergensis]|uniref:MGH1-like glycoside hydrolase domain-containing protein n=1 Tax=Hallella bergensis TaxID=242750 RepID=UPI0039905351